MFRHCKCCFCGVAFAGVTSIIVAVAGVVTVGVASDDVAVRAAGDAAVAGVATVAEAKQS